MTLPVGIDYEAPLNDLPVSRATWDLDAERAAVLVHDLQRYFVTPFTDGCPALAGALAGLETLPPARIEVPLAGRRAAAAVERPDGSSYFVWVQDARLGSDRHSGQLELRATDGSPVALWMEKTLNGLARCWTSARP